MLPSRPTRTGNKTLKLRSVSSAHSVRLPRTQCLDRGPGAAVQGSEGGALRHLALRLPPAGGGQAATQGGPQCPRPPPPASGPGAQGTRGAEPSRAGLGPGGPQSCWVPPHPRRPYLYLGLLPGVQADGLDLADLGDVAVDPGAAQADEHPKGVGGPVRIWKAKASRSAAGGARPGHAGSPSPTGPSLASDPHLRSGGLAERSLRSPLCAPTQGPAQRPGTDSPGHHGDTPRPWGAPGGGDSTAARPARGQRPLPGAVGTPRATVPASSASES